MGTILCATRGGEESVQTELAAIEEAAASESEVVFFYVVNVDFMARAKYTLRSDVVHEELGEMAEFLMAMAVERAHRRHVRARALIRHGEFAEELVKAAVEVEASLVVLGRPGDDEAGEHLEALVGQMTAETGIPFSIRP